MTRANRAHVNAVENVGAFAAVVLIAQRMKVSTPTTVACAVVCFLAELVHANVHVSRFGQFRGRCGSLGWVAFLAIVVLMRAEWVASRRGAVVVTLLIGA